MLVNNSGELIPSSQGWKTVCLLVSSTGLSPEACATALEALHVIAKPPVLCPAAFLPCLECIAAFIENQNKVGSVGIHYVGRFRMKASLYKLHGLHDLRQSTDTTALHV